MPQGRSARRVSSHGASLEPWGNRGRYFRTQKPRNLNMSFSDAVLFSPRITLGRGVPPPSQAQPMGICEGPAAPRRSARRARSGRARHGTGCGRSCPAPEGPRSCGFSGLLLLILNVFFFFTNSVSQSVNDLLEATTHASRIHG